MSKVISLVVALPPRSKARPRVTCHGTYMPPGYSKWRQAFVAACAGYPWRLVGRFRIGVIFWTRTGDIRPDLDNALGAVLDALQDAGIIEDDRLLKGIDLVEARQGEPTRLEITLVALD